MRERHPAVYIMANQCFDERRFKKKETWLPRRFAPRSDVIAAAAYAASQRRRYGERLWRQMLKELEFVKFMTNPILKVYERSGYQYS